MDNFQKMKRIQLFSTLVLTILFVACINKQPRIAMDHQRETVFPKGNKITNNYFTGTAWLQMLVDNDSTYDTSIGNVTFEPGARTNWHIHPGGQILLVTAGKGYYQEKGKPAQRIRNGDVVRIPPETEHWHGAAPDCELTHVAINPSIKTGKVAWLAAVSDEEYRIATQTKTNISQ